jgi:cytochrome c-type biogenesis protein CcmH
MTSPVFWVLASLLTILALAFLLTPLWRQRQAQGRWPAQALIASVAIVPLTIALYFTVTTWDPDVALDVRAGPGEIVTQLAQRLEQNPDDVTGWRMLGRSYHALGQYAQAREAFRQAFIRTDEPDNDLKLYYGESMVLTDRDTLAGEAGRLFEEVLAVEPNNPTALWWGGVVALEAGRADLARERWTRLLAFNPPGDVAEQLQALLAMVPGSAPAAGLADSATGDGAASAAAPGASIRVAVSLSEDVPLADFAANGALFIFARAPGERAPLAALRLPVSELPGEFVLSDSDAMLPGRSLADLEELQLVARLSASGDATERAGDWYAQALHRTGDDAAVEIVIDRRVE